MTSLTFTNMTLHHIYGDGQSLLKGKMTSLTFTNMTLHHIYGDGQN